MNFIKIKEKLGKLTEEQAAREQQVAQWQEQIDKLGMAIRQTKEAHDYTRGQIAALRDLLSDDSEDIVEQSAEDGKKS
jgi:chromosome segregation ATPase